MQCPGFDADDYAFFALGTPIESRVRAEIEDHLVFDCETCIAAIAQAQALWYAVASGSPAIEPHWSLRNRVVGMVEPGRAKWLAWFWQPLPALGLAAALMLAVVAGWQVSARWHSQSVIALSPLSPPVPITEIPRPTPVAPAVISPPAPTTVIREVADPAQTRAIDELRAEVQRQQTANGRLEGDLAQQRQQLASAQDASQRLQQQYQEAVRQQPSIQDLQTRLANASARAVELERQVAQYRVLLETQRRRLDQTLQMASMVSDPGVRIVYLRPTEKSRSIEGHAVIASGSQMVFYASKLPPLPANRSYQLWLIRSNGPAIASAGVFTPDSSSRATLQLNDPRLLTNVTTLAVTDGPAGGSPQPTGHKWMIGS